MGFKTLDEVVWGMIGCGNVTEVKNGPGLYKSEGSRVKTVYSRTHERAVDYASRHGIPNVARTVEELLADGEINAVYIATPPKYHRDYAIACLKSGKVPLIEKPMANRYSDCEDIMRVAEECGIPAYMLFYRRGLEKFIDIKRRIEAGEIGNVRFVSYREIRKPSPAELNRENPTWRLIPDISGGGKFLDVAVHVLDALQFIFGDIVDQRGFAVNRGGLYEPEDTVSATFTFESGLIMNGLWCYASYKNDEQLQIEGDAGRLTCGVMLHDDVVIETAAGTQVISYKIPEHIGMPYEQSIIDELRGKRKSNANLKSSANVTRVTDALLAEYRGAHPH